jgi:hypothetical protein
VRSSIERTWRGFFLYGSMTFMVLRAASPCGTKASSKNMSNAHILYLKLPSLVGRNKGCKRK